MEKVELVRTKKSNRIAIYTTDPVGLEPLFNIISDWVRDYNLYYGNDPAKVIKRDSIYIRRNGVES